MRSILRFAPVFCAVLLSAVALQAQPESEPASSATNVISGQTSAPASTLSSWRDPRRLSYQVGVGFITASAVDDIMFADSKLAERGAGGEIYLVQVSYKAAEFDPELWGHRMQFDLEIPAVLGIVNENGSDAFPQYSAGVTLRWKTFPWNRWLYTNLETGIGLTYSSQVLATERVRHPGRDRSHLEFYWPIQLTIAHPRYRRHQLVLFNHHHSGGTIFHKGGANTLGIGYRYVPAER